MSEYQSPIPKVNPEHRRKDGTLLSQERRRAGRRGKAFDATHRALREKNRFHVWNRDHHRCRKCGARVDLKADNLFTLAHIHEIEFRSQGGGDLDPTNTVCLCNDCHLRGIHHQMSKTSEWFEIIVVDPIHGAENPDGIKFVPWEANAS